MRSGQHKAHHCSRVERHPVMFAMPGSIAQWHLPWDPVSGRAQGLCVVTEAGKVVGFLSPFPGLPQLDSWPMTCYIIYTLCSKPVGCNPSGKPLSPENIYIMIYYKSKLFWGEGVTRHDETVLKCHSIRKADVASYVQESMKAAT